MSSNANNLRAIGRVLSGRVRKTITMDVLTTSAYAIGDVLSTALIVLPCVAAETGGEVTLHEIRAYEKRASGLVIAPKLQVRFFRDSTFTPAAQNAPFEPPTSYKLDNGKVTIETADWEDYDEASFDKHAIARVRLSEAEKLTMGVDADSQSLFVVVTIDTASTFAASAAIELEFIFEPH